MNKKILISFLFALLLSGCSSFPKYLEADISKGQIYKIDENITIKYLPRNERNAIFSSKPEMNPFYKKVTSNNMQYYVFVIDFDFENEKNVLLNTAMIKDVKKNEQLIDIYKKLSKNEIIEYWKNFNQNLPYDEDLLKKRIDKIYLSDSKFSVQDSQYYFAFIAKNNIISDNIILEFKIFINNQLKVKKMNFNIKTDLVQIF